MANLDQILQQLRDGVNGSFARLNQMEQAIRNQSGDHALIRQELARQQRDMQNLSDAMSSVRAAGGGAMSPAEQNRDYVRYINEIPGRRIPFDMIVEIPIGSGIRSEQQGTETVSQDGPFIATRRFCAFQSAHQFSVTDPDTGATAAFQGRSYGRFRPVHSTWDVNDAGAGVFPPVVGAAFPGTGAPIIASPSNHSSFRTMEFDGVVNFINQGSGFFRSNRPVPTSLYIQELNSPFELASFDFFERGEVLQWKVTPTHVSNPAAGNVQGILAGGAYPFIASQFDVHEGIADPFIQDVTSDPVSRLPDGILIVGFHGFRIIQAPGPVRMI